MTNYAGKDADIFFKKKKKHLFEQRQTADEVFEVMG
jgi:hypothetical protein